MFDVSSRHEMLLECSTIIEHQTCLDKCSLRVHGCVNACKIRPMMPGERLMSNTCIVHRTRYFNICSIIKTSSLVKGASKFLISVTIKRSDYHQK